MFTLQIFLYFTFSNFDLWVAYVYIWLATVSAVCDLNTLTTYKN